MRAPAPERRAVADGNPLDFSADESKTHRDRSEKKGVPGWVWAAILGAALLVLICVGGAVVIVQKVRQTAEERRLPAPTTNLRVDANDLERFYKTPSDKHQHQDKAVLVLARADHCFGAKTDDGAPVFMYDSDKGFRRPTIVFKFASEHGWKPGPFAMGGSAYIEGTLRSPVAFTEKGGAKDWLNLTPNPYGLKEHYILVSECRLTSEPK